jgi:hypothetical protein
MVLHHGLRAAAGNTAGGGGGGGGGASPEFNWKYFASGNNIKQTKVYWRKSDGTMNTLRTITGEMSTTIVGSYDSYTEDLSAYSGETGRIMFSYNIGSSWQQDPQFDAMELVGTTNGTLDLDPQTIVNWMQTGGNSGAPTIPHWIKGNTHSTATFPGFNSTITFTYVPIGTSASNRWNYDSGGTPSSSTGNTKDSDNSSTGYYLYFEGSSPNYSSSQTRHHWCAMDSDVTLN